MLVGASGSSFMTPVAFAIASTPESASTTPTNELQFSRIRPSADVHASVDGLAKVGNDRTAASSTTTMTVGTETRNARPPVCFGPK